MKELKEKIEEEVKEDFDFEQYLFKKYPDLFYTGEDGELLPQWQRCWNSCPKGWEPIVDHLFGSINSYVKNTSQTTLNPNKKIMHFLNKQWIFIRNKINKIFNPYKNHSAILNPEQKKKINDSFCGKIRALTDKVSQFFYRQELYISQKPNPVKIAQYKEKFGTLRIYIDGGDDDVYGMIRFAEYLSSKTCQHTSQAGDLYNKNGWYVTLSPEKAEQLGFCTSKDL